MVKSIDVPLGIPYFRNSVHMHNSLLSLEKLKGWSDCVSLYMCTCTNRRLHIKRSYLNFWREFYCKFGIYNAKSIFCQNIVPLGQLEAEILIDLCSIKRSYFPDPIKRSYVTEWSVLCTYTTTIFLWVYYTKNTFQSIWHQFIIIVLL